MAHFRCSERAKYRVSVGEMRCKFSESRRTSKMAATRSGASRVGELRRSQNTWRIWPLNRARTSGHCARASYLDMCSGAGTSVLLVSRVPQLERLFALSLPSPNMSNRHFIFANSDSFCHNAWPHSKAYSSRCSWIRFTGIGSLNMRNRMFSLKSMKPYFLKNITRLIYISYIFLIL